MAKVSVLGAGSWGSALAIALANAGQDVLLWGNEPEHIAKMKAERANTQYLPAAVFPANLSVSDDLMQAMAFADLILVVVPSHAFKPVLKQISPYWTAQHQLLWATKGLDESGNLLHLIAQDILGETVSLAVLSGPSFALEVAAGMPTAVTIASVDLAYAQQLAELFNYQNFRAYISSDIVGAQLGGAVKNVLAIATGISDGLGYGANARAALITRGLAEMIRLGEALSANPETFIGLTGLGDLVLTCTDDKSRNRRFGLALGRGESVEQAQKNIGQVVEGVLTAKHVLSLAARYNVEMPITEQVSLVLSGKTSPQQAVKALLARPIKPEMLR